MDHKVYFFEKGSSTPLWSYLTNNLVLSVSISSDGEYIVAGSSDTNVYLWDKDSSTPLWTFDGGLSVNTVSISEDGNYITAGTDSKEIYCLERASSTPIWTITVGDYVQSVSISSNGDYICAGSEDKKVYFIERDSPPKAQIDSISPSPALNTDTITFQGSGIDDGSIERYSWYSDIDGELNNGTEYRYSTSSLTIGDHLISLKVQDDNGVWSDEVQMRLIVHRQPNANIVSISPINPQENEVVHFNGEGDDDGSIERYMWISSIDGELFDNYDSSFTFSQLSNGTHSIALKVQDDYGVWSDEDSYEIIVNGVPRASIVNISPAIASGPEEITFIGIGTDDGSISRYSWRSSIDGTLYNSTNEEYAISELSNGSHEIYLKVQDNSGIWSQEVMKSLIVNGIPSCNIDTITPDIAVVGSIISFIGNGTDDGTIVNYVWRIDDTEIYNGTDMKFTYSNLSPGSYIVQLKVKDNYGIWSEEVTSILTITELNLLITIISPSEEDTVNGTIRISGEVTPLSSEADSQILMRIDNGSWEESTGKAYYLNTCFWQLEWNSQSVENGQHTIFAKAFDGEIWSNIAQINVTVENQDSADLIPLPQWDVGDKWTWSYMVEVEGQSSSMTVTEEIKVKDAEETDNGTVLAEPCYKLVAKTLILGQPISTSTAYLSIETLELLAEDFQGEGMPLFLYGFMAEIDWPLIITGGGPYQWSDAGEITVDAGTYSSYKFEGAGGPLYYSQEVKHLVKADLGEITFELKKGETDEDDAPDDVDDDGGGVIPGFGAVTVVGAIGVTIVLIRRKGK